MKKFLFALVFLFSSLSAASFKQDSIKIVFSGYKTQQMAPLSGTFKDVKYKFNKNTKDLASYLKNAKALINTNSVFVDSNEEASANLAKIFFPKLAGDSIKANFLELVGTDSKGIVSTKITINKKSVIIPFSYTVKDNKFVAKAQLDLHNFKNSKEALEALTKAAPGHEGLTWPVVDIEFSADLNQ